MGCSQDKETVGLGLKDEIKRLQEQKSKLIIEKDELKKPSAYYSSSEADLILMIRKLTNECSTLNEKISSLEEISTKKNDIIAQTDAIKAEILESEADLISSLTILAEKRQECLLCTEQLNKILKEKTKIALESMKNNEHLKGLHTATQENIFLDNKISELQEKLKIITDINFKIYENQQEIIFIEESIARITPLIEQQNQNHKYLLDLDGEISSLQAKANLLDITESEINYLNQLIIQYEDMQKKIFLVNETLDKSENYNFEERRSERDSYLLIKNTLKRDLRDGNPGIEQQVITLAKLENKKLKLESILNRKIKNYDVEYETLCFKLQKKQAQKVSLETQLKEFKEIAAEIDI